MTLSLLRFSRPRRAPAPLSGFLDGFSLEVMPRTAAGIEDFRALIPEGSRVYVAHISGTPIEDMVATAARLRAEGMEVMPHLPARIIPDRKTLNDWISRYTDQGIDQFLMLGGGVTEPEGSYDNSMQLLETGLFDGCTRLHVAGHPEGNRDIDPEGGETRVMEALQWKQSWAQAHGVDMAITTQFAFEAGPIIDWAERLKTAGITLPVHLGIAGPAKLQTMLKFAIACGVGPSLRVLQRRARDVTKLVLPFEPGDLLSELAAHKAAHPDFSVERVHFFPLGGIKTTANWIADAVRASEKG